LKHETEARLCRGSILAIVVSLLVSGASAANAAMPTPAQKCEAKKNRISGEYADCLAAAERKFVLFADAAEYAAKVAKCDSVYARDWQAIEQKAGAGECPSEGDETDIQDFVGACHSSVADALSGNPLILDPVTCNTDLENCGSALEATGACDVQALQPGTVAPVCSGLTCSQQCDPVDTDTCAYRGGAYVCDAPSCSCGPDTTTSCTLPPPICDPVCEPPSCGTSCDDDQCGDQGCPNCEVTCGTPTCASKCHNIPSGKWPTIHPCAQVFGCSIPVYSCNVTCQAPDCYWVNNEMSGTPPVCEATLPLVSGRGFPDKTGLDCSAPTGSQDRDWEIVCESPECEISCPVTDVAACSATADCEADCDNPICTVTCDTPTCAVDPATGANVCTPPANCTTSCQCRVGVCTRAS